MEPHYFQFLTPLVFLILATLPGQITHSTKRKIAWAGIVAVVLIQGSFSYWRAWEEYLSPNLDDIGYTQVLAQVVAEHCKDYPQIRFVSGFGIKNAGAMFRYRFDPELAELKREGTSYCKNIFVFQNKLRLQFPTVSWYLQQLTTVNKLEAYNNQIWIIGE